jgi:hypothetical protein
MAHGRSYWEQTRFPARGSGREGSARGLPGQRSGHRPYLLFNVVNGKHPLLTREPTDTTPVMAIFGGTTEIQKEIIARSLGL